MDKQKSIIVVVIFFLGQIVNDVKSDCLIKPQHDEIRETFTNLLALDATELLRIDFVIDESDKPDFDKWTSYLPEEWTIVTKDTGQYIITSPPDTEIFSVGIFGFVIKQIEVPIISEPVSCLRNMSEEEYKTSILNFVFSGMKSSANVTASLLPENDEICFEKAIVSGNTVSFRHQCCVQPGDCKVEGPGWWQDFLFYLIFALKLIAFLYAANCVPEYLYKDKYGSINFYCKLDKPANFRVIEKSEDTSEAVAEFTSGDAGSRPKPSSVVGIRETVKGHNYSVKGIWFKVWENRLVSKAYLPIGLFIFLYQRLVQCTCFTYRGHSTPPLKLKQLTTMRDSGDLQGFLDLAQRDFSVRICCELPICNPQSRPFENRFPKWHTVLHVLMTICSTFIFAIPWLVIHLLDEDTLEFKRAQFAHDRNLVYTPPFYSFNLLRYINITLTALFFTVMIFYIVCVSMVTVILKLDTEEMAYLGRKIRATLRNSKERWETGAMKSSRFIVTLFLPFKLFRNYGLLAFLLWPIWIVVILPFAVLIVVIGNAPTVNVFFRLFILFLKDIGKVFSTKLIRDDIKKATEKLIIYTSLIVVLFILQFFVFALVSLVVNVIAYTFVAVIVTAQQTVRYTAFAVLVIVNARDCFTGVKQRYTVFHDKLQASILAHTRDEVKKIARRQRCDQVNTAFKIKVESEDGGECLNPCFWQNLAISEKNKILWNSRNVVQFLDNDDKVYLSERFFFDACYMDYYGCPGDFASNLYIAVRQVFLITAFLAFVVFTLNAFGGIEANNSSGLLVTLATGLLPLFVRRFFSKPIPELSLDTEEFHFQNYLDSLICGFSEYWEVIDFDVEKLDKDVEMTSNSETDTAFWLRLGPSEAVQLAVRAVEGECKEESEVTIDSMDIEMRIVDPSKQDDTDEVLGKRHANTPMYTIVQTPTYPTLSFI